MSLLRTTHTGEWCGSLWRPWTRPSWHFVVNTVICSIMELFYRANIHNNSAPLVPIHYVAIKWKHFPSYWLFWGESTGHRWIPLIKTSDAELWCFLWSAPEQTVEETIEPPVIWNANALIMMSLQCTVSQEPCTKLLVIVSSLTISGRIQIWKRLFSCCDE